MDYFNNDNMSLSPDSSRQDYASIRQREEVQAKFIAQVFTWMAIALGITAFVAMLVVSTPLAYLILNFPMLIILSIVEVGLVWYLSANINKISANTVTTMFIVYSVVNGLTMSLYFVIFTGSSVAGVFFLTAGMFATMAMYGYKTKKDLTQVGNLAMMALVGVIIASFVNIILRSNALYWIISYIGVIIFVGLTAYDTQKLKARAYSASLSDEHYVKTCIMGALDLYLDFINLFIYLIRIFGKRRN
jgi:FtsH-binding integral membrane protein